jgi:hypothetical protein
MVRIDDVNDAFIFVYGTGSSPHKCDANIRRLGSLVLFLLAINGNLCIHVVCIIYAYTIQVHISIYIIYNIYIFIFILYTHACIYYPARNLASVCRLRIDLDFGRAPVHLVKAAGRNCETSTFCVLFF